MTFILPFTPYASPSGLPEWTPTLESLAKGCPDHAAAVAYFSEAGLWGGPMQDVVDDFDGVRVYDENPREMRISCNSADPVWLRLQAIARAAVAQARAQARREAVARAAELEALEEAWVLPTVQRA